MLSRSLKLIATAVLLFSARLAWSAAPCETLPETNFNRNSAPTPYQPCDNFELTEGSATTATTLWLLAELHSNRNQTIDCVEKLTKNIGEHQIYLELYEAGKEIPCKKPGIKEQKGRKCIGWDNLAAAQAVDEIFSKMIPPPADIDIVTEIEQYYLKNQPSDIEMDRIMKLITARDGSDKNTVDRFEKTRAFLLARRKSGDSYKKIFSEKKSFTGSTITDYSLFQTFKTHNKNRNKSLLNILKELPTNLFSVVIAGKAHLIPEDEKNTEETDELLLGLRTGKHQKQYAKLAAKN